MPETRYRMGDADRQSQRSSDSRSGIFSWWADLAR
jgi:hypothetical protein